MHQQGQLLAVAELQRRVRQPVGSERDLFQKLILRATKKHARNPEASQFAKANRC